MAAATRSHPSAETQLASFIGKFAPDDQRRIRAVRAAMRRRLPTANELVYDNYNFLVIGYSPTERPSDSIFSIAARAGSLGLCFLQGAGLPDPKKLLEGAGTRTRFIRLPSAAYLADPAVASLMRAAITGAKVALPSTGRRRLIIRSISARQRSRRAAATGRTRAR